MLAGIVLSFSSTAGAQAIASSSGNESTPSDVIAETEGELIVASADGEEPGADPDTPPETEERSNESVEGERDLETIVVVGHGITRTQTEVSTEYMESQAPGLAPQQLLVDLPGVNIALSDPFGMYELNERMTIRGFSATQLGNTIDGVPFVASLAEGGTVAHYVLSQNLARADVSSGAGDVTQPAVNALGGAIRYTSMDPTEDLGGQLGATVGNRFGFTGTFAKFNTGQLGDKGPTAYIAAARNHSYQWENYGEVLGSGGLDMDHVETKIRQQLGRNSLSLRVSWDKRSNWDTENVDVTTMEPFGANVLYESPSPDITATTLWHGFWRNGTDDWMAYLQGDFYLGDNVNLKVTPYYNDHEYWLWYGITPDSAQNAYDAAMAGTPGRTDIVEPNGAVAQRIQWYTGDRTGVTTALTWNVGLHKVEAGVWYEANNFSYFRPIQNSDPVTGQILVDEITSINADYDVDATIFQPYLKGTASLFDGRMTIQAGFKGLQVDRDLVGYRNAGDFNASSIAHVSMTNEDWFQPQLGLTYSVNDSIELFANYAENFSAVTYSSLTSVIYNPDLKPESSKNIDVGIRFTGANWSGYIAGYRVEYTDRIISLTTGDRLSAVTGSTYINVAGTEANGVELSGDWSPTDTLKLTTSWSFSHAVFSDDYYAFRQDEDTGEWVQDVQVEVGGKYLPDQPLVQGNLSAYYNLMHFSANLNTQYVGKRYATNFNNLSPQEYAVVNGGVAWKGLPGERLEGMTFRLSGYNLFNKKYISRVSARDTTATGKLGYPFIVYGSVEYEF